MFSLGFMFACGRSEVSSVSGLPVQSNHLKCFVNIFKASGSATVCADGTKIYPQTSPILVDSDEERDEYVTVLKKLKSLSTTRSTELKFNPEACDEIKEHHPSKLKKDPRNAGSSVFVDFDYRDNGLKYKGRSSSKKSLTNLITWVF
ncbi:MAG: hypothetical protein NTX25_03990 [Proteobacteria bacterium]|nr:hypothetical protein [Pseudomonadota bacterium]